MVNGSPDDVDLRRYVAALWRRRWIVFAITVAVVAGATLQRFFTPPTYQAVALIQLDSESEPPFHSEVIARFVIDSATFIEATGEKFDPAIPTETVRDSLRIDVRGPMVIRITSQGPTAEEAYNLAESASRTFVSMASRRAEAKRNIARERLAELDTQIARILPSLRQTQTALEQVGRGNPARGGEALAARVFLLGAIANGEASLNTLLGTRAELKTELATLQVPALIAAPALPSAPTGADPIHALLLATILGLILGITVAAAWDFLSPSLPRRRPKGVTSPVPSKGLSRDMPAKD